MTSEIAPHIPQPLHAAMAEWGRHHAYVRQIDGEAERLDAQITDLQRTLTELGQRHADLGRKRKAAADEAELARGMVAYGCQSAGIEMPAEPPAIPAPPVLPAGVVPVEPGADALHALGRGVAGRTATETVTDPPDGGDQPAVEPGFHPESGQPESGQPAAEPRRRRGGRRDR